MESINKSKETRDALIEFLKSGENLNPETRNAIIKLLNDTKYGLVYEEHLEENDVKFADPENYMVFEPFEPEREAHHSVEETWTEIGETTPDCNFILEGDNYVSLTLLKRSNLEGVDVVYFDPPYNTGNEDWTYNNKYMDKEDSFKHSKWLSFIEKRVRVAKSLMKDSGIIVAAIDHYELAHLTLLMDQIFGEKNRLGIVSVVNKANGRNQDKFFATSNEFALFYAKNNANCEFQKVILSQEESKKYTYYSDDLGTYRLINYIRSQSGDKCLRKNKPSGWYPIYVSEDLKDISIEFKENYIPIYPILNGVERTWIKIKSGTIKCMESGELELVAQKDAKGNISIFKKYREGQLNKTHWIDPKYHATFSGTDFLEEVFNEVRFDYPKSIYLMEDIIKLTCPENGVVLDFFAGSGTTGHAVLNVNQQDGGNRHFILCTNNEISPKQELKYLHDNGYLLNYIIDKSKNPPTNSTIKNKIKKFYEENPEIKKQLLEDNKEEFEKYGICQYVTYPRLKTVITGIRPDGTKYSDGIVSNLKFFKAIIYNRKTESNKINKELSYSCRCEIKNFEDRNHPESTIKMILKNDDINSVTEYTKTLYVSDYVDIPDEYYDNYDVHSINEAYSD